MLCFLLVDEYERDVVGQKDVVVDVVEGVVGLNYCFFYGWFGEVALLDLEGVVEELLVELDQALDVAVSSVEEKLLHLGQFQGVDF